MPALITRDSYNQEHTYYLNGHRIDLTRRPDKDTDLHHCYQYQLTTKDGAVLFGKPGDTCGIPKGYGVKRSPHEATMLAFRAVTMQEPDTDESFFSDYTPQELDWCRSYACEYLGYEVSDLEERAS